jgi:hypothetical protein
VFYANIKGMIFCYLWRIPRPLGKSQCSRMLASVIQLAVMMSCGFVSLRNISAQDLDLSPTRPTVANSATIPGKDVLQVETGYDV